MSSSNSTKDTVLQLSVGKLNGGQKIRHSYKSIIVRWFRKLKNLSITRKIIYFMIIVMCCLILYHWYLTYHNRDNQVQRYKTDKNLKNSPYNNINYEEFEKDHKLNIDAMQRKK
ncbi:uncharacterized protein LOC113561227 isoform X1 [Rhopalosiphum maidis]|uniref:uncharacterized protein LOC113561227 isoform X1 n=1 Tax=Rhopalosiphum maidis TaxID=43146 RepID=UPI000EFF8F11|nr:uncharacterized protein LOC113561227 isoform X1 [Rhopalosiphum maidis]